MKINVGVSVGKNPSDRNCECDKSCGICKCSRKLVGELVEEFSKNIDENEMIYNETLNAILLNTILLNDYKKVFGSCTLYIVLFAVFLVINTIIFIHFYWYSKKYYQWLLLI